jgi:hypothetical protein
MRVTILAALALAAYADGAGRIESKFASKDFPLTADPASKSWKAITGVFADAGPTGEPAPPGHRTEIRSRWTKDNLYVLFICPYDNLNLKPNPNTTADTWQLWEWDVAEVFVGADFQNIGHYREYQVSPQNEWIDLDIYRMPESKTLPEWNSGFKVKARIDEARKTWYGEMQIPISSINGAVAEAGKEMRINFYRMQGKPRVMIAWQPTGARNYHIPQAFGRLVLVK